MNSDAEPLFVQVANFVADLIVAGSLKPGDQAPSTNQLAQFHEINPATARKGLTLLADDHVLEKRRGLGMFVTEEASKKLRSSERERFLQEEWPLVVERIERLGLSARDLLQSIGNGANE